MLNKRESINFPDSNNIKSSLFNPKFHEIANIPQQFCQQLLYLFHSCNARRGDYKMGSLLFCKKNYKILAPHSFEYVKNGIN